MLIYNLALPTGYIYLGQPTSSSNLCHMLQTLTHQIATHELLEGTAGAAAAQRVAAGVMRVRRASNAKRRFAVTFAHLGKLNAINSLHLRDLIDCFAGLIRANGGSTHPTVLGLAESGIIPSFAMHRACQELGKSSRWFCTTRSPNPAGIGFTEPHSHAPDHFFPTGFFDTAIDELWVVEDEITTGKTLNNLLHRIMLSGNVRSVRVYSLLDTRDPEDIDGFSDAWKRRGLQVQIESVLSVSPCFWQRELGEPSSRNIEKQRPEFFVGESVAQGLPLLLSGQLKTLQQITLSPWMIDGQHVISRQQPAPGYYLYNVGEVVDV